MRKIKEKKSIQQILTKKKNVFLKESELSKKTKLRSDTLEEHA
jgi:hypothetical protein